MAKDGIRIEWNDRDVQQLLAKTANRIKDFTPAMKGYAEYLVKETESRFKHEKAPDGTGWKQLKPATIEKKRKNNKRDKILQQDGYLMMVHPVSSDDAAGVYSDRKYAAIHNRGGMAGRGRKVKIPKREFLGVNDADINEFTQTVRDWVILGSRK